MRRICTLLGLFGLPLWLAPGDAGADYVTTVVMNGLNNPRGLAFGPDGSLYVAESGRGTDGPVSSAPSIVNGNNETNYYGATGSISKLKDGVQSRVITGLPSLAAAGGAEATGLQDIAFNSAGEAFGVIGFGANPAVRSTLGAAGANFGTLVRLPLAGGPIQLIADLAAYEGTANPDGTTPDSNPFSLLVTRNGDFIVTDAGGNTVLGVTAGGAISTLAVVPPGQNPSPPPPVYQGVPTGVAQGPDGSLYIGQLTGFPFPPGAANVYSLDPATGALTVKFPGFTNIIDMAFGPDGSLYVLQLSTNGLASPTGPGPGALFRVNPLTGAREQLAISGLNAPTGLAIGPDGSIYVSNLGTAPGDGQVVRITAVPEPTTFALLGLGLAGLVGYARRCQSISPSVIPGNRDKPSPA